MKKAFTFIASLMLASVLSTAVAQSSNTALTGQTNNYISTGMPILLIAPDAISSGMGDAGAATTPDVYSAHWNNAKFAFIDGDMGFSTTYTPWLRNLGVGDMNLLYLSGYKRINSRSAFAASLTYFSLGDLQSTDEEGNSRGTMMPNEFAIDGSYAMKLSDELSLGASGRFIRSDLTNNQTINDGSGWVSTKPAWSLAADLGLYYQHAIDRQQEMAVGAMISNLGAKLSYSNEDNNKEFLPANLRLGFRYTNELDDANKITVAADINKLLVPTPSITIDSVTYGPYGYRNKDYYSTGVIQGALQSFYDAPGGLSEELQELQISLGGEYWYKNTFAARAGYFYENSAKGGRRYATIGFGLRFNLIQVDVAYLVPTTNFSTNPLANTIKISLTLNFEQKKKR